MYPNIGSTFSSGGICHRNHPYPLCIAFFLILLFCGPALSFQPLLLAPIDNQEKNQTPENQIYDVKVVAETNQSATLEIDYYYSGKPDDVWLGAGAAIPAGYRPYKLCSGKGKASVMIILASGKRYYDADEIFVMMYKSGGGHLYTKLFSYQKRWCSSNEDCPARESTGNTPPISLMAPGINGNSLLLMDRNPDISKFYADKDSPEKIFYAGCDGGCSTGNMSGINDVSSDLVYGACGQESGEIKIWRLDSGQVLLRFQGHGGAVRALAFSPDGKILATSGADKTVKLWNPKTGALLKKIATANSPSGLSFSPSGRYLALSGQTPVVLKAPQWKQTVLFKGHNLHKTYKPIFSPSGKYIAAMCEKSDRERHETPLVIWRVSTGEVIQTIKAGFIQPFIFSRSGEEILGAVRPRFSGYTGHAIKIWRIKDGALLKSFPLDSQGLTEFSVEGLACSPSGNYLLAGLQWRKNNVPDRAIDIWELVSGKLIHSLHPYPGTPGKFFFRPGTDDFYSVGVNYGGVTANLWKASFASWAGKAEVVKIPSRNMSPKNPKELVELLNNKDEEIWKPAWIELFETGTDEVVDALTAVLNNPGHKNDKRALDLLRTMENPKAVAATRAIDEKKQLARQEDDSILEKIRTTGAAGDLIAALERPNPRIRMEAAIALGIIKSTEAIKSLLQALREDAPPVNGVGRQQFRMEEKRFMCLMDFGMGDWYYEAQALAQIGTPQAIYGLVSVLNTGNSDQRAIAATALGKGRGPWAEESLIRSLKDKDESVRLCAARSLRQLKAKNAVKSLRRLLKDSSDSVRYSVASSLALLDPPEGMDILAETLKSSDTIISADAAKTLCLMPTPEALEKVLPFLRQTDNILRSGALLVLQYYKREPQAVDPLIIMLMEEDKDILEAAATALGRIGDKRAVEPLIRLLRRSTGTVAGAAAMALGNIGGNEIFELLSTALKSEDPSLRAGAAVGLGSLGDPRGVELLMTCLSDENSRVSNNAIGSLGKLKDTRAVEPLVKFLETGESHIRVSAAAALARLNDPRGIATLLNMLKNEPKNNLYNIINTLTELGKPAAIPALEELAQNGDWRIKEIAKTAVAQIRSSATYENDGKKLGNRK